MQPKSPPQLAKKLRGAALALPPLITRARFTSVASPPSCTAFPQQHQPRHNAHIPLRHCAHGLIHSTRVSQFTCIAACLSPSSLSRGRFAPPTQWFSQSACALASASFSRVIDSLGCLGFGLGFICSIQHRTIAFICSIIQTVPLNRYRYDPDETCNNCSAACQPTGKFILYRFVAAFSILHGPYNIPPFTIRSLMLLQA
jgi:hypothetical protein